MAARSCLKCKEQRLIGFEGYNCGSTAVVKCRWAALLHQLPQSKNHVVAASILPFTNLLYLTLQLSHSNLSELCISYRLFCIGIIEMKRQHKRDYFVLEFQDPGSLLSILKSISCIFRLKEKKSRYRFLFLLNCKFQFSSFKCDCLLFSDLTLKHHFLFCFTCSLYFSPGSVDVGEEKKSTWGLHTVDKFTFVEFTK